MTDLVTRSGRRVEVLAGDPARIIARGEAIESLGAQMEGAAVVLEQISEGAQEQKGRSIEKIRDEVGDVHRELALAAARYSPTGAVMRRYGMALDDVTVEMRRIVPEAEAARDTLRARESDASSALAVSQGFEVDATDPTSSTRADTLASAASTAAGLVTAANEELDSALREFDVQFDLWDAAYERALDGIEDATTGNITDDWTDDLAGVVEIVLKVLQVAGVLLALAALIIGGPLFAALAAIAGLLALLATLYLAWKGRRNGGDIAWAVVGVLPFGKLGKVFSSGNRVKGLKEFVTGPVMEIVTPVRRLISLRRMPTADVIRQGGGMGARAADGLARSLRQNLNAFTGAGPSGIVTRITQGSSRTWTTGMADAFANMSPHHRSLVAPHLGVLDDVVTKVPVVTMPEMAINVVEFGVKRSNMAIQRSSDLLGALTEQPVDAWSAEINR